VELCDAGHILGSCSFQLTIREGGRNTTIIFSGDIGRYNQPILKDPQTPPAGDYVICESTYGDREHPDGDPLQLLADIVNRVVKRGGAVVVPGVWRGGKQTVLFYF